MRIGYCSPFNPMKSGISDFSEELVSALAKYEDIVLFSPEKLSSQALTGCFETHMISELEDSSIRESLDILIYHIGNNDINHGMIYETLLKYPGIVELHEIGLHHFMASHILEKQGKEAYLELLRYCHGSNGTEIAEAFFAGTAGAPWEEHNLELCMARPVIEAATAVIVHSEMVKQMVLGIRPETPVVKILHHSMDIIDDGSQLRRVCRKKLGISEHQIVFGTFGFVTQAKRILQILDALAQLGKNSLGDYRFFIVGEVAKGLRIEDAINTRGLERHVTVTGFTSLELFKTYMAACNFCINLRYPTQGESSGSLHRMFGMGVPAIVTDIGTFADFPDDVAIKVRYDSHEVEDLTQAIRLLMTNRIELKKRGQAALHFAKEFCDLERNAQRYADFFWQVAEHIWQPDYEDTLIARLCELGLTSDSYTAHLWDTVDNLQFTKSN